MALWQSWLGLRSKETYASWVIILGRGHRIICENPVNMLTVCGLLDAECTSCILVQWWVRSNDANTQSAIRNMAENCSGQPERATQQETVARRRFLAANFLG